MLIRRPRGFTIIELMVGLVLLGVLVTLALPSFTQMLQNTKLRAGAEAITNGLQLARSQALRRNQPVEFLLTSDDPIADNAGGPAVTTNGPHWMVRTNAGAAGFSFVQGHSGFEGSSQAAGTQVQIAAVVPSSPAAVTAGTVTFNPMGRAELTADATFDVSNPAGGACKTAGGNEPMRCLRVVVTPGGRVRMCDPAVADATDTRAC
ncbi:MAG: GspH/FimT family pseudopilin [Burkholderiales bacterium]|nr:GspH/FimT family pseudopilin [Burkholderiales bacterium]